MLANQLYSISLWDLLNIILGRYLLIKIKNSRKIKIFGFLKFRSLPQDVYLFDGYISQNIILNQNENNDQFYQRLEDVCKKAEIYDFVKSLKKSI